MEGDDVGGAEKLVEREPVAAAVMDDAHPERLRAPGDLGADPSQPDEAERRACEVASEQLGPCPAALPATLAHEPVRLDEVAAAGEDQREREIGHRGVEHAGCVRHRDPALAARGNVHTVVADAVVRHQPQAGQEVELVRPDCDDRLDQDVDTRPRLRRRPGLEQRHFRQLCPRRPGERLRGDDRHARSISATGRCGRPMRSPGPSSTAADTWTVHLLPSAPRDDASEIQGQDLG